MGTMGGHLFYVPFPVCPNLFKKKRKKRKKENKKKQQKKKTRPNKRKQCKRRPIGNIYLFYFDSTGMENLQYTEKTKLNEEVLCSLMMYDLIHELKFCISLSLFLFFEKPLYQTHFVSTKKRENPPSLLTFTYSICNA